MLLCLLFCVKWQTHLSSEVTIQDVRILTSIVSYCGNYSCVDIPHCDVMGHSALATISAVSSWCWFLLPIFFFHSVAAHHTSSSAAASLTLRTSFLIYQHLHHAVILKISHWLWSLWYRHVFLTEELIRMSSFIWTKMHALLCFMVMDWYAELRYWWRASLTTVSGV